MASASGREGSAGEKFGAWDLETVCDGIRQADTAEAAAALHALRAFIVGICSRRRLGRVAPGLRIVNLGLMIVSVVSLAACASPGRLVETWVFERPGAGAPAIPQGTPRAGAQTAAPSPVAREVAFPFANTSPDPARPETLAQFALDVAAKGEIADAAKFLVEAADHPAADSEREAFRIACLAAAASLYLRAGDVKTFQVVAARLRRQFDRYQLATVEPNLAALLAVASVLDGQRVDGANVPWILRDLRRTDTRRGER
jgi:hypothetical protein